MRPNGCERLARWGTGVLLVLLVQSFDAPRSAWAGCNHLVTSQSDRILDHSHLDALIVGDTPSTIADDSAHDPLDPRSPRRRMPCSGPGCSGRTPMPVPSAFPESDRSDQWGVLSTIEVLLIASPPCRIIDEAVPHSSGQPSAVFHPPRG